MRLTPNQSRELLARFGMYVTEACDKCTALLGPVRFIRRGEPEVFCSPVCRGDSERQKIHKGGRPRKHKDERTRKIAHAKQQREFRGRSSVTKTCQQPNESKGLAGAKTPLSAIPLTRPLRALKTHSRENGRATA